MSAPASVLQQESSAIDEPALWPRAGAGRMTWALLGGVAGVALQLQQAKHLVLVPRLAPCPRPPIIIIIIFIFITLITSVIIIIFFPFYGCSPLYRFMIMLKKSQTFFHFYT